MRPEPLPAVTNGRPTARRTEDERDALMRIAAAAAAAARLEDMLEPAAEAAHEALGPGSLTIGRWERDLDAMRPLINVGDLGPTTQRVPDGVVYPLDDIPTMATLLRSGEPMFTAVDDPDADPAAIEHLRIAEKDSGVGVTIVVEGRVWGAVFATSAIGAPRFARRQVEFLETLAGQLAAVIARAELFSSVSRLAYEDELTGLANRRALEERLERAVATHRTGGAPLSLILGDVDDLKTINDERGHQAGDRALRRVAEALVAGAAAFPAAVVGRLSGDEFAVLLPDAGLEAARAVATTALDLLREDRDVRVSLSCGAAAAGPGVERADALLRAADTAQYAAKRRGGGQFCTAAAGSDAQPAPTGRRRSVRRSSAERFEQTTGRLLAMLDGEFADRSALDRLEAVVTGLAQTVNAAAWTISFCEHGGTVIRSMCAADDRDTRLRGVRVGLGDEVYALAAFPLTASLVDAGAGAFVIDRHDRFADAAERELLGELGYAAVLGAVVSDLDGSYLVEIYGDGDSADLTPAELRLQLLMRAAAGRSTGAAAHMRSLTRRTQQLAATGALGARLAGLVDAADIVEVAVDELYEKFGFPVCAIDRLTPDGRIELVAGRGPAVGRLLADGWGQPAGLGLIGRALREGEVVIVGDVAAEPDYRASSETEDVRSEMVAPLWAGDRLWGAIDIEHQRPDAFDEHDAAMLRTVADQVSAALRSAALYALQEQAYLDTAEALVSALEAKDSDTATHSRSIADHAAAVGRALGMNEAELRTLRLGAAFHDIGKLAIPESVLGKPGPLDAAERAQVEQHTVIGEQILAPIEFLADVRPLVRSGHERWDGAGYPDGLAGERIPLGARIIFACDAYDAMTTDRPYRSARSAEAACAELLRCAGTQFDARVVGVLVQALGAATSRAA